MKVGILYPQSIVYPNLMMDFIGAFKISIHDLIKAQQIEPIYESIGMGGDGKAIVEKLEKLILVDEVNLLVAFMDFPFLERVQPVLDGSGKLLIIVNTGANYPSSWKPLPNIICLSLNYAFCSWLTGKLAVENDIHSAVVASSFYDCGYLSMGALIKSFNDDGGEVAFNYINNQKTSEEYNINSLIDFLINNPRNENLLCVFNSFTGCKFLDKLKDFSEIQPLNLFVAPMMLENLLDEHASNFDGIAVSGYTSFQQNDFTKIPSFSSLFFQKYLRQPSSISLLGFELGLILQSIIQHNIDVKDLKLIVQLFPETTIESPRGSLHFDVNSNFFISPIKKVNINNGLFIEQLDKQSSLDDKWHEFIEKAPQATNSGWLNTYLCY